MLNHRILIKDNIMLMTFYTPLLLFSDVLEIESNYFRIILTSQL